MKGTILILIMITLGLCQAQRRQKSELSSCIEANFKRVELSKLFFFSHELIELGCDTTFLSMFRSKKLANDRVKRKTTGDQREYHLILHQLYRSIQNEKVLNEKYKKSQASLLTILKVEGKLDFFVDENLILEQIDSKERNLMNGYDEGSVEKSIFVFFTYSPEKYKDVLLKNGKSDKWERIGVFLCNYLRENENPQLIRNPIKKKILEMVGMNKKMTENEFQNLRDCDVSINLFD